MSRHHIVCGEFSMGPALRRVLPGFFLTLLLLAHASIGMAGPVRDFEDAFRAAYADYRTALFTTNTQDAAAARNAMSALLGRWQELKSRWGNSPPPQYADDAAWQQTLARADAILAETRGAIDAGKLEHAHEVLESFRDEIGRLHARNGVITFSDHMNAYHSAMEKVLADSYDGLDDAGRRRLAGDLAVLAYLASNLERFPPAEAAGSADFGKLLAALRGSLVAANRALASADAAAIRQSISALKPAYAKFFLRFG
jgi:hypothetical protein